MNDGDASSTFQLAELLRHPDDLHKISALKSEFTRKKAAVDAQIKLGLAEKLQLTQSGLSSLHDGQSTVAAIKQEMLKIDRLGAEAQGMIRNFPEINAVAQAHRNFVAADMMLNNLKNFQEDLEAVKKLLKEDEGNSALPNLLATHRGISRLRNTHEDAVVQFRGIEDSDLEVMLNDNLEGFVQAVDMFDDHVGRACVALLALLKHDHESLIVRLAIVIEEEEKFDLHTKELQEAQREFKGISTKFETLVAGPRELRGYKEKLLRSIKEQFDRSLLVTSAMFQQDPDSLMDSLQWFFGDLTAVRKGMAPLMPKKWKILQTYIKIYHGGLRDWLQDIARDPGVSTEHVLAVIHFKDRYLARMRKTGAKTGDLEPALPGGSDGDLVRDFQQLVVSRLDQWMTQLNLDDKKDFEERNESALSRDGLFQTKSKGIMWQIMHDQLIVAKEAGLRSATEGICDAMFRAIQSRLQLWRDLTSTELAQYTEASHSVGDLPSLDSFPLLQDWLFALANDQMISITDNNETGQLGYLSNFQQQFSDLVSEDYRISAINKINQLKGHISDLSFHFSEVFAKLVVVVDFRIIMRDFFTPAWYSNKPGSSMGSIITTFQDYLSDYRPVLHDPLGQLLVSDFAKALLLAYLSAVHNKGAKFRRAENYQARLNKDYDLAIDFFDKSVEPDILDDIMVQWSAVPDMRGWMQSNTDIDELKKVFDKFRGRYWDVKIGWIEALLRCRDDIEWGPLGDGRTKINALRSYAADNLPVEGPQTILGLLD